jgi:hypothetical protein
MKKLLIIISIILSPLATADDFGPYVGGGLGYSFNSLEASGSTNGSLSASQNSAAIRGFAGFQFFSFLGVEAGYNYLTQSSSFGNYGQISSTIYDLSVLPGFSIPGIPIIIFGRLGIDANASSFNSDAMSQLTGDMNYNLEWGGGVRLDIPTTSLFVRGEYINYSSSTISNNGANINIYPSVLMATLGYTF